MGGGLVGREAAVGVLTLVHQPDVVGQVEGVRSGTGEGGPQTPAVVRQHRVEQPHHPGGGAQRGQRPAQQQGGERADGQRAQGVRHQQRATGHERDRVGPVLPDQVRVGGEGPAVGQDERRAAGGDRQCRQCELGGQPASRGDALGPGQPGRPRLQFAADQRAAREGGDRDEGVADQITGPHQLQGVGDLRGGAGQAGQARPDRGLRGDLRQPHQPAAHPGDEDDPGQQGRAVQPQQGAGQTAAARGQGAHRAAAFPVIGGRALIGRPPFRSGAAGRGSRR